MLPKFRVSKNVSVCPTPKLNAALPTLEVQLFASSPPLSTQTSKLKLDKSFTNTFGNKELVELPLVASGSLLNPKPVNCAGDVSEVFSSVTWKVTLVALNAVVSQSLSTLTGYAFPEPLTPLKSTEKESPNASTRIGAASTREVPTSVRPATRAIAVSKRKTGRIRWETFPACSCWGALQLICVSKSNSR